MVNKQYKDATIKLFLTSEKGRLIRLVNSVWGTNYSEDTDIEENTLDTPVFMAVHNDISFCCDHDLHLILIEHQSTLNENMPLRMLMYLGRVYEKIVSERNVYATKRIKLPVPHFLVLYSGEATAPEVQTMNLRDAFEGEDFGFPGDIELRVKMLNINYDENQMPSILKSNPELKAYVSFIKTVRNYMKQDMNLEEAVKKTIFAFSGDPVMGPFLDQNASEVLNMLMAEWDTVQYGQVQKEEGKKEGVITACIESVQNLMDSLRISFDEACKILKLSADMVAECKRAIKP